VIEEYIMSFEEWENKNNAALRREKILIAMIYTVISILAVAILSWIMFNSLNTPEVEVSWSTKQCIRVVYMDGTTDTCDNKPEKYDIVWVK
jgi:flagellar basal body-associated protein FliL